MLIVLYDVLWFFFFSTVAANNSHLGVVVGRQHHDVFVVFPLQRHQLANVTRDSLAVVDVVFQIVRQGQTRVQTSIVLVTVLLITSLVPHPQ